MPAEIEIALYDGDRSPVPRPARVTWEQLVALVATHAATECTRVTCAGAQCPHKRVAAWSPVVVDGYRRNDRVRAITALVVDLDHLEGADLDGVAARINAEGLRWCLATSHQHAEDAPRYRLVMPVDRPVTPAEYPTFRRGVLSRLRLPGDPRTGDLSRIYYLPTSRADCPPRSGSGGSRPLSVDAELAAAPPPPPEAAHGAPAGGAAAWLESTGGALSAADAERLEASLAALPPRGQGAGSTFAAYSLIFHDFGLGIEHGWPYLVRWSEGCGMPHSPAELERQVHRCGAAEHRHPRGWRRGGDLVAGIVEGLARPPEGSWAALLAEALAQVAAAVGERGAAQEPEPLGEPYEALAARDPEPVDWLIDGLVKSGGVTVLGGRSKIGKSWILTSLALAVATGSPALGAIPVTRARRAFYFYAEDGSGDVRSHAEALLAGADLDRAALGGRWTVQPAGRFLDLTRDEDVALVVASVRLHGGADLVVLEPLRDLHSAAEGDGDEMAPVMRRLLLISSLLGGASVLVSHHESKPSPGTSGRKGGERLRGSVVVYASASGVISVTPVKRTPTEIETRVEVETRGARSRDDFGLILRIEDDERGQATRATWQVTAADDQDDAQRALVSAAKHPADAALVLVELERHALATRPELVRWRERGCLCPVGSVVHAQDLYARGGAHKVEVSRQRQRAALQHLVSAGAVVRMGGEHGALTISPERVAQLVTELGG